MNPVEHTRKTFGALKWNIINQLLQQFTTLGIGIALARLLGPGDYGVVGMIMVFSGFLHLFKDFGLGSALIQKRETNLVEINTIFWVNVVAGLLLSGVLFFLRHPIGVFFNNDDLAPYVGVFSVTFIVQSFGYVQSALLRKGLQFKKLFGVNLIATVASGGLGIWMASAGFGAWSLIAQMLTSSAMNVIVLWYISEWRPSLQISIGSLKPMLRFGVPLLGTQTIHYWTRNADNLLVGKFLGENALGIYSRAYSLMLFPVRQIAGMLSGVMFPSIAIIQDDLARVRNIYVTSIRLLSIVTFPLMGLVFVVADQFVYAVLGSQWHDAIDIIRILCLVGAMQSISTLNGNIFQGLGKTTLQFRLNVALGLLIVSSIAIGILFDLEGVAYAYLISTLLSGLVMRHYIARLIGSTIIDLFRPLLPGMVLSLVAVMVFMALKELVIFDVGSLIYLLLFSCGYAVFFISLFYFFVKKEFQFTVSMVKQLIKSK